ncbi:MAG: ribosome silencing factor [bacterium]|nr:ribosome silencing factor [bacterium]
MYPKQIATIAGKAALSKKAEDVSILNVKGLTTIADYLVFVSGNSGTHIKAITEAIEERLKKTGIVKEEKSKGWVLLDYGSCVVNIFDEETRAFYQVENLWADAEKIPIE